MGQKPGPKNQNEKPRPEASEINLAASQKMFRRRSAIPLNLAKGIWACVAYEFAFNGRYRRQIGFGLDSIHIVFWERGFYTYLGFDSIHIGPSTNHPFVILELGSWCDLRWPDEVNVFCECPKKKKYQWDFLKAFSSILNVFKITPRSICKRTTIIPARTCRRCAIAIPLPEPA